MRRWLIYLIAVLVLYSLPEGQGTELGKLNPAGLIYIYKEADQFVVRTDTKEMGKGVSVETALEDLRASSGAEVFLDTVDYILVTEDTKSCVPELEKQFRLSSNIVLATGQIDAVQAADFLAIHNPELTLLDYVTTGKSIPKLMMAGERYYLESNR